MPLRADGRRRSGAAAGWSRCRLDAQRRCRRPCRPIPPRRCARRAAVASRSPPPLPLVRSSARRPRRGRRRRRRRAAAALAGRAVDGRVVSGEGEKDDAPMLHPGERFGTGAGPARRPRGRPGRRHAPRRGGPAGRDGGPRGGAARRVRRPRPGALPRQARDGGAGCRAELRLAVAENLARLAAAPRRRRGRPARRRAGAAAQRRRRRRGSRGRGIRRALRARRRRAVSCTRRGAVAALDLCSASAAPPKGVLDGGGRAGARRRDAGAVRAAVRRRGVARASRPGLDLDAACSASTSCAAPTPALVRSHRSRACALGPGCPDLVDADGVVARRTRRDPAIRDAVRRTRRVRIR